MTSEDTIGQRIARLIEERGLNQAELAEKVGVTRAAVNHWVMDNSPNIRPENLLRLADVLGTDVYYLVRGEAADERIRQIARDEIGRALRTAIESFK